MEKEIFSTEFYQIGTHQYSSLLRGHSPFSSMIGWFAITWHSMTTDMNQMNVNMNV